MLLDQYLVPLTELAITVALPLVLTLKALQLSTRPSTPPHTTQRILAFWLTYWLIVSLAQSAGVNSHVRSVIAAVYYSKSRDTLTYLLGLYQNTLLPFTSSALLRVARIHLSTEEVDNAVAHVLERMCFDDNYFADSLLEMAIPKVITPTKARSFWPLTGSESKQHTENTTVQEQEQDVPLENIIPLEMARVRSSHQAPPYPTHTAPSQSLPLDKPRSRRRSHSLQGGTLSMKPSKQDLRSSSWNTADENASDPDELLSVAATTIPPPPRVASSADLVFEESPSDRRTSIRGSLKGLFA